MSQPITLHWAAVPDFLLDQALLIPPAKVSNAENQGLSQKFQNECRELENGRTLWPFKPGRPMTPWGPGTPGSPCDPCQINTHTHVQNMARKRCNKSAWLLRADKCEKCFLSIFPVRRKIQYILFAPHLPPKNLQCFSEKNLRVSSFLYNPIGFILERKNMWKYHQKRQV